jgi:undecaprenyl-diphosphatase
MVFSARYLVYLLGLVALLPWLTQWLKGRFVAAASCVWRMPAAGILAAAAAFFGNWAISLVYFRERPFESLYGVRMMIGPPLTPHSFPSSHSSVAFAVALTVVLFHRRFGIALLPVAALIAFSRVFVGVHYPFDVLVGAALGCGWAILGARLFGADYCLWLSGRASARRGDGSAHGQDRRPSGG